MEDQNVYMGYASFVYYLNKKGYKVATEGKWYILFWLEGENSHRCELTIDENRLECGSVYINTGTLRKVFRRHNDLIDDLLRFCIRPNIYSTLPINKNDYHCNIEPSLWGKIETEILTKQKVACLHLPQ